MHFDVPHLPRDLRDRTRINRLYGAVLRARTVLRYLAGTLGVLVLLAALWVISAPPAFPANSIITIPSDATATGFATTLESAHVIRSGTAFRLLARLSGYDHHLDPGAYVFTQPVPLTTILWRVGHARHGIQAARVTLTEGMTRFDMAATLERQLPGFDATAFLEEASTSEGYLFPDTYLFMPGTAEGDIVTRLKSQFSLRIADLTPDILSSERSFSDIVIMASLLEREAQDPEDMQMVAGILWNRIDQDMPLQVDAVFGYIHQKNGYAPTAEDLELDSPYNTYRNRGLPPTPISNPGVNALYAALHPADTDDLYYLTGKDGEMHYAADFEEHKKNRAKYLD